MTKIIRRCTFFITVLVLCLSIFIEPSSAETGFKILEPHTGEDNITVYVKGTDASTEKKAQIGTTEASVRVNGTLTDIGNEIYTLILIDNSASIKSDNREKTKRVLQDIVLGRKANEKMSVATYDEGTIKYLCDYIDDSLTLNGKISELNYEKHKSYLTDVLFEVLSQAEPDNPDKIFRRIIVISDGSDRDGGKYRSEELDNLITRKMIPIYTVCCYEKKKDADDIKWLTSLSRMSGGIDFNLTASEDASEFARLMQNEADIVKMTIIPDSSILDGQERVIKIFDENGEDSVSVAMPQKVIQATATPTPSPSPMPTPEEKVQESGTVDTQSDDEEDTKESLYDWILSFYEEYRSIILIAIGGIVLLIGLIVLIVSLRRKKKNDRFEKVKIDKSLVSGEKKPAQTDDEEDEETELVNSSDSRDDDDHTSRVFSNSQSVRLRDITGKWEQQLEINERLRIGKAAGKCDFVIDYDKAVSSVHCEIIKKGNQYFINDLGSTNGTKVDNYAIYRETEIRSGSIIKIGRSELRFEVV